MALILATASLLVSNGNPSDSCVVIGLARPHYALCTHPRTCAVVMPIPNRALVLNTTGKHYWVHYADMGEYIAYNRDVPALVRDLVENRRGTTARIGCSPGIR